MVEQKPLSMFFLIFGSLELFVKVAVEQKPLSLFFLIFGTLKLFSHLFKVAVEPKPLSLAEEDLLSDLTYDELKRAFR